MASVFSKNLKRKNNNTDISSVSYNLKKAQNAELALDEIQSEKFLDSI